MKFFICMILVYVVAFPLKASLLEDGLRQRHMGAVATPELSVHVPLLSTSRTHGWVVDVTEAPVVSLSSEEEKAQEVRFRKGIAFLKELDPHADLSQTCGFNISTREEFQRVLQRKYSQRLRALRWWSIYTRIEEYPDEVACLYEWVVHMQRLRGQLPPNLR